MIDSRLYRCAAWVAASVLLALTPAARALQVTDDRGVSVTLPRSPQRIVSLLPSLTETVCELDACARLVGVDRYSNYPATVRRLPQVGGGIDPNIEAIVALKPDLVLMATSSRGIERLQALGVPVLPLEPRTAADVQRVIGILGRVLEVPGGEQAAQRVWRAIDAGVSAAAQSLPPSVRSLQVYFEASGGPYAAGPQSFIGETLARLGVRNIITPDMGPFPKINPEYVVRAKPDIIMISQGNAQGLAQRPGWARLPAIAQNRVCVFSREENDVLVRPGPRMAQAARLMAQCIASKSGGL